jgi:hypothetical protein
MGLPPGDQAPAPFAFCIRCHAPLPPQAEFCATCGGRVSAGATRLEAPRQATSAGLRSILIVVVVVALVATGALVVLALAGGRNPNLAGTTAADSAFHGSGYSIFVPVTPELSYQLSPAQADTWSGGVGATRRAFSVAVQPLPATAPQTLQSALFRMENGLELGHVANPSEPDLVSLPAGLAYLISATDSTSLPVTAYCFFHAGRTFIIEFVGFTPAEAAAVALTFTLT